MKAGLFSYGVDRFLQTTLHISSPPGSNSTSSVLICVFLWRESHTLFIRVWLNLGVLFIREVLVKASI